MWIAKGKPKSNYVTTIGKVGMVRSRTGTVTAAGGFLGVGHVGLFLEVYK